MLSAVDDDFRVSGRRHLAAPDYDVLLEVVTRAVAKLNINWPQEEQTPQASGSLMKGFLSTTRHLHAGLCHSFLIYMMN